MNTAFKDLLKPALQWLPNLLPKLGSRHSIGLYVGHDRLNLVQMKQEADHACIRAIASIPFQCSRDELSHDSQILKGLLKQAYAAQPFKGKHVVSCLPADQIKIITITYKFTEGQPDAVAVVAELRERLKDELDEMVVDFMTLRQEETDSGKREALVALAPREKVVAYLDLLTSAGLKVDALDIGPAALTRLVVHAGAIHTPEFPILPNVLLVNFGTESSFITIIWGRRLMLDRSVEFSENRVFSRLKQVLDMPQELAMRLLYEKDADSYKLNETEQMVAEVLRPEVAQLLQEINKTLVYMASRSRGKSVDKIYLTGRVARYSGILNYLREQLHVPVEILDPIEVFAAEKCKSHDKSLSTMAGIALTTGLALRGIPEHG
jgi:type IV pilus assembly protein PilM